ncbi:MAG TPA: O-antigen ligase family protein [Thermoanaerobaculia bacterium]|nr:O-antigen ligase family protein [Thermoanaerobaculia bacterium]
MLPPLLLLLFGAWCGTFAGSASAAGSTVGAIALLGTVAMAGVSWRDPLRLGRWGRLLPPALWLLAAVSAWRSPVPRASWMALLLLPAFLLLPGAVARFWSRLSSKGITVLVLGVSLWALIDHAVRNLPRAAMTLGQHNLLAAWLVILLPLALLAVREPGAWRWLGLASGLLGAATILATRSLAGNLALAAEVLVGVVWIVRGRRSWAWVLAPLVVLAAVGLFSQRGRIASILAGQDLSVRGRMVYYEGALEGIRARPVLGWGPGSAAWTAGTFFDPVPGVSPFGESVGELHSLPLHVGYEVGLLGLGLSLSLGATFLAKRLSELRQASDPALVFAGVVGLWGAAVASLGSASLAVTALPVACAVAAGAALSALEAKPAPSASRLPVLLYVVAAAMGLAPLEAARWAYDRGDAATAARIDPRFPLYRMRLALLQRDAGPALAAARDAPGVATLWTVAGILGAAEGRPWADEALERACALDPFNPFPPFYLMTIQSDPRYGAHALLAEPRLAAATFWESHPDLLARSVAELERWPGVDMGWKEALIKAIDPIPPLPRTGGEGAVREVNPTGQMELEIDTEPPVALSLHTFRRRPFPIRWPLVQIRLAPLAKLDVLPPATTLPGADFKTVCRSPDGQGVRSR